MKLPYSEYVAAVRREGASLRAAAAQGLDVDVRSCPGWTVSDLVSHVAVIYRRVALILSTRATTSPPRDSSLPEGDLLEVFGEFLDDVVGQLAEAAPDTPVWNWSEDEQVAAFWARRMAHESSIHRFDAQQAHGMPEPIVSDLAADGLDEMIDIIIPRVVSRDDVSLGDGELTLRSSEDREWRLRLCADGVERIDVTSSDAPVVSGTTSLLLLAVTGRVPWDATEISGDRQVLEHWTTALRF